MRYVIVLLAIVGVVVSGLALQVHYSHDVMPCSINEHWDCGIVNHSRYAEVLHIPVAVLGIAGYAAIGILALFGRFRLVTAAALLGLCFALYLTHVEADILHVWCLYCVISQATIALTALVSIIILLRARTRPAAL